MGALDIIASEIAYNVASAEFTGAVMKYRAVTVNGLLGPARRTAQAELHGVVPATLYEFLAPTSGFLGTIPKAGETVTVDGGSYMVEFCEHDAGSVRLEIAEVS